MAEVPIDMEMSDTAFFEERYAAYFAQAETPALMEISTRIVPQVVCPDGEHVRTIRSTLIKKLPDGNFCHYRYFKEEDNGVQLCVYRPDFSKVDISISQVNLSGLRAGEWEHAYAGFDFASRLGLLGGAVLHGSSIAYKGRGVIFSAPSGTGKSTHTRLWKKCFGDDVEHINDDKPALRFSPDGIRMYGTPWSGKSDLNVNKYVPLHAVVFVERGEQNAVRRLDFTESLSYLQWQVVQPYHDGAIGSMIADRMITLAQTVPVYLLTCNMDDEAAYVARKAVFDE